MNHSFTSFLSSLTPIITAIKNAGGVCYLVGGSVRDYVLNIPLKDFDIEVHKLSIQQLEAALKPFGHVMLVGKKFGVLRLTNYDVDWSLPRKDSIGRKPDVSIDPCMPIDEALKRRDITMNAMAIDLNEMISSPTPPTIIDPYGGLNDIKNKQLRAVDTTLFLEDPLRFYRVMQFIGRFEMQPDAALNNLCATMHLYDTATNSPLASERIYEEIKKLFLRSTRPSLGFRWLLSINRLEEIFPEIQDLVGVVQRADYHPEGDVFEHSMQALDAAARLTCYQPTEAWGEPENEKFLIMLGALCHDLGKTLTTTPEGRATGHETAGVPLAHNLMRRLTNSQALEKAVVKLVQFHLLPFQFIKEKAGKTAYKRLAFKLAPEVSMRQLGLIALVDTQGRNDKSQIPLDQFYDLFEQFLEQAEQATVTHGPEAPVLLGRHLLDVVPAGPELGKLLHQAYEIQIEEGVTDWLVLRNRVLKK